MRLELGTAIELSLLDFIKDTVRNFLKASVLHTQKSLVTGATCIWVKRKLAYTFK